MIFINWNTIMSCYYFIVYACVMLLIYYGMCDYLFDNIYIVGCCYFIMGCYLFIVGCYVVTEKNGKKKWLCNAMACG